MAGHPLELCFIDRKFVVEHLAQSFFQLVQHQSLWMPAVAFLGGVVSSMLPCCISMLPIIVGYVGGFSDDNKWSVARQVLLFVLGSATVLTVLGIAASLLGLTFGAWLGSTWFYAIGVLAIVIGLNLLHVIQINLPFGLQKMPETKAGKWLTPYLLGLAFGITNSPCGTPFLTAILGLISQQGNLVLGGVSLFCYALGQGALLLVIGLFTGLVKHMAVLRRVGGVINNLSGAMFILVGFLLIAQGAGWLYEWIALIEDFLSRGGG
jgi:cytochrome c-type biogenesis protein